MKFGLAFASSICIDGKTTLDVCQRAGRAGFESVWVANTSFDPTTLRQLTPIRRTERSQWSRTPRCLTFDLVKLRRGRSTHPKTGHLHLDRSPTQSTDFSQGLATLDQLSGGRVELGLGIGWMKEEFDALGIPWSKRGARNDEYIEVMRTLWAGPHARIPRQIY